MLTVVCWRWGTLFDPVYVYRLQSMLQRHLHLEHQLVCVTDNPEALPDIPTLPITEFANAPRCRRRMAQYSRDFPLSGRLLSIDLDVVIVDDITPLVRRKEPVVMWRVGYADVYSGSFVLWDAGALHGAYEAYARSPERYPRRLGGAVPSDQAMLNAYLPKTKFGSWSDADGFVPYFGRRYERHWRHGLSPRNPQLPPGTRVVVLGSDDKAVLERGAYPWVTEHWR